MSILDPWNALFALFLVIYLVIRGRFASRTKDNKPVTRHVDGLERLLLAGVILTCLLLPALFLFTPLLSFADYEIPAWLRCCGAIVMPLGLWLFWHSHADLGLNWSATLEIQNNHTLVTSGVYRRVRHPMYAAMLVVCLAQGMMLDNWLAGWAAMAACGCLYVRRAPIEEQMMIEQFGNAYENYQLKTGRLVPKLF